MQPWSRKWDRAVILRYAAALGLVIAGAIARRLLLNDSSRPNAPFLFFYPAIAFAAFFGGAGAGFAAMALSAVLVLALLPQYTPGPVNWFWLCVLGPVLVLGFSRIKRLRDLGAQLANESLRLRFVVDRVSDWIFLTDEAGAIQYANRTACAELGCKQNELIGRSISELASPEHRAGLDVLLRHSRDHATVPTEIEFPRQEGPPVSLEIGCTAIAADNRRVIHVAGRDITERKSVDLKLIEARRWEGLGVLAGGIAHEFNNLLTSIIGNASLARDGLSENDPMNGLLRNIEIASDRSAELVRMMLATSGYRPRYREAFRVDRVLLKLLGERHIPAHVAVRVDTESAEFESDLRLIETLLWALISNAVEAYGEARGEVSVWIRAFIGAARPHPPRGRCGFEEGEMPENPCLGIVVKDQACGMSAEVLSRAFDPFFTTKFTGRGLGLPAVRGIVRAHRGKLWVRTNPNEGTKVEVWLPGAGYDKTSSV